MLYFVSKFIVIILAPIVHAFVYNSRISSSSSSSSICPPYGTAALIVRQRQRQHPFTTIQSMDHRNPFVVLNYVGSSTTHLFQTNKKSSGKKTKRDSKTDSPMDEPIVDNNNNIDNDIDWETIQAELVDNTESNLNDTDDDWKPDYIQAQARRKNQKIYAEKVVEVQQKQQQQQTNPFDNTVSEPRRVPSAYTEEEEEIIEAMGGRNRPSTQQQKEQQQQSATSTQQPPQQRFSPRREYGYLGDCTLQEIASDYSVPVSYLADVLCTWGVPPPINVQDRLGDMVTGEQAFAILEAINTLDVADLNDRYSNMNLMNLCYEYDMNIQDAFEMCMKEGYNLPFGVQTCLRVEQEDELLRVVGSDQYYQTTTKKQNSPYYDDDDE